MRVEILKFECIEPWMARTMRINIDNNHAMLTTWAMCRLHKMSPSKSKVDRFQIKYDRWLLEMNIFSFLLVLNQTKILSEMLF